MKKIFIRFIVLFIPSRRLRACIRHYCLVNRNVTKCRYNFAGGLLADNGVHIGVGRYDEYDLIFGIGSSCYVTTLLDIFNLRKMSTPFEWTDGIEPKNWSEPGVYRDTRFVEKIDALCYRFKNWTNLKDFVPVSDWVRNKEHHALVNIRTKVRFIHHFPIDRSIENYMVEFREKQARRAERLLGAIEKSEKILICWVHSIWDQRTVLDKPVSNREIIRAVKKVKKSWPKKSFDFVFFEHDGRLLKYQFDYEKIADNALKIKSNHFICEDFIEKLPAITDQSKPHIHLISEAISNIRLSEKLSDYFE